MNQQSGAVGACWAHNPEVDGSKPSSANFFFSKRNFFAKVYPFSVSPVATGSGAGLEQQAEDHSRFLSQQRVGGTTQPSSVWLMCGFTCVRLLNNRRSQIELSSKVIDSYGTLSVYHAQHTHHTL